MLAALTTVRFSCLAVLLFGLGGCLDPTEPGVLVHATVDEDDSLPALELSETRLHLQTFGDPRNPPLVLLHGGPGNDHRYLLRLVQPRWGPGLADEYFVIVFDQRGAGLSRRHEPEALTLDAYLRDLEEVIDTLAPERQVILFGHSWGGQYAAMYMNAHPERVTAAVLAEPGRLRWDLEEGGADFDFDPFAEHIGDLLWARQLVSMQEHARADYVASLLLLEDTNARVEDPSPNWRVGAAVLLSLYLDEIEVAHFDWTPRLAEVEGPVLFVVGDQPSDLGASFQTQQLDFFVDARMVEIAGAGHSDIVWKRAEDTLAVTLGVLAEVRR